MVYKVYKSNNYIIIIDENDNYFEEHCANVLVTKLLTPSTTYNITFFRTESVPQAFYNVAFANIRQQSGAPYANVATWESWYTLNTGLCSNAAVLNSILATLQAQTDVEGVFVKDVGNLDKIILQVKVWDQDSQQYIATYYYNPDGTLYTPVGPLEWVGTAGSVNATIISPLGDTTTCGDAVAVTYCAGQATEFFDQGDTLDSILTELTTGTLDVNITNSTLAVTQSGTWTVALDAATLLALETITVEQGTSPWVVSATDLDIRDLDFATDSVDVSGSNVNAAITGPFGVQSECDNALSVALCQTQADILSDIQTAVQGTLDVNIVSSIELEVNLDPNNDAVTIYGSNPTVPVLTDGAGHLQVDVLTIPEVEIKNDAGNPISVSAIDLDIRALDCNDKVTLCSDGLSVGLTGTQLPVGLYADDLVSGAPERLTTTGSPTYQALDVNQISFVRTPNIINGIASGTITVPVYSITFFNAGPSTEVIYFDGGVTQFLIPPGVSISMDAGGNNTYPANVFGYDVVGDGPIIITYNS